MAGAWNDVIAAFIDLHKALERFSQGQIKISGGIEIYPAKYPVHVMAEQTADLEEKSKSIDGKMQLHYLMRQALIHGMIS